MAARELFERSVQRARRARGEALRLARRALLAGARRAALAPGGGWRPRVLAAAWSGGGARSCAGERAARAAAASSRPTTKPVLAEADEDDRLYAWLAEAPVAARRRSSAL
jgi:hypothetical protein